jgi:hypothetical protein
VGREGMGVEEWIWIVTGIDGTGYKGLEGMDRRWLMSVKRLFKATDVLYLA